MRYILTAMMLWLSVIGTTNAQQATTSTNCYSDYVQLFDKRGTFPVQDGIQKVTVAILDADGKSNCYIGQIMVQKNNIVPPLYISRSDGSLTQAIGNFDEDFYKQAEGRAPRTITNAQTATYMLKNNRKARLFFMDFLKPETGAMMKAPDMNPNAHVADVKKEDIDKINLNAKSIQFETNKATITTSSNSVLDVIVQIMKQYPNSKWSIEGYTDNVGSEKANILLSHDRAVAVQNYLVKQGVNAANLYSGGKGSADPIADNSTAEGRAQNRRVEIKFIE